MRARILVLTGFLAVLTISSIAQEVTGDIRGTVKDPTGAVVSGATVTVTNTDKNAVIRTTTTNQSGQYSASLLAVGRYSVTVNASGFKKITRAGIELNVHDVLTQDFSLQTGSTTETVQVEAEPLQVQLQDAAGSGLINGTQIRQLSINNRNYEQLVALSPGVATGISDQIYIGVSNPAGTSNQINFAVNGNRPTQNNWTIDGVDNVDRGANLTLLNYPSVDSIEEFKLLRGAYNAEYGRSSSGQITVVTRSGGQAFHGGLYEFFRNDVLNANTFANNGGGALNFKPVARPKLRYNDFGGTLSGPVYIPGLYNTGRNKTFFFFSEEVRRVITYSSFHSSEVPTQAELQGTFPRAVCLDAACSATGTQINNINPVAAAYIKDIFSKVNYGLLQSDNTFLFTAPNVFNARQEVYKVDHIFGPKLSVFGRFTNDNIPTVEQGGLFTGSSYPGVAVTNTNSPGKTLTAHATLTLSPTLLNEAGYGYSYGAVLSDPVGLGASKNSPDIKPNLPFASQIPRVPDLSLTDGEGIFGFGSYRDYNRNHSIFDNLTKVVGRHSMKFGITYNRYHKSENTGRTNNGSFVIPDSSTGVKGPADGTFQQTFANFLIGNVSQFTQLNLDFTPNVYQNQIEVYGQDEFRWKPNFTVSYGVRYSHFQSLTDGSGHATSFDPKLYNPSAAPSIDPTNGNLIPGTGTALNGVIIGGKNSPFGNSVAQTPNLNFAPRIGVAWDPFSTGVTSIRAGYGLFFDSPAANNLEQYEFSNPPFVQSVSISSTSLDNPAGTTPNVNLSPPFLGGPAVNWKQPYTQEWSLDFQRQLAPSWIVDVGYYGSKGTHLIGIVDINQPVPGAFRSIPGIPSGPITSGKSTARLNFVRPFRGFDAINIFSPIFDSNYHGLQTQLQKRFRGNSLIVLNYTWSRAMTDAQSDFRTPQNTYDIRSEYGPAQFDRRHVFNVSYVYELPFFTTQQGFVGHALGGWEVSGITYLFTGLPLTVTNGQSVDPAGLGLLDANSNAGRRPNQIADPNVGAPHTVTQWFNTSAYLTTIPAGQTFPGTSRRGAVRGPGYERWDVSLFKNNKITERLNLQFRAEAFNVFNHTNPDTISTSRSSGLFGRVTGFRDPRIMQLALKLNF